jgi:anaerobic magnesium-protoporphyrin IX monomethyl ester cyclase
MKVLLVSSPRYYWPYMNEDDNFLLPQSLVCLAAAARQAGIEVKIVDCMASKIGWKSLERLIREERPDAIGVGENHALYVQEAVRVLELAKTLNPGIVRIGGGAHFTNLLEESLRSYPLDYVVKGEGEVTFVDLLQELGKAHPRVDRVRGIAYLEDGRVVETPPQPLVPDLDSLPLPAYDLVPMENYGRARYIFSPGGTTIHHSRGCTGGCRFCAWWIQMADVKKVDGRTHYLPRWRTKSVGRIMEEIEILHHKYGKRCLVFVDESWNISQRWNDEFAEALLAREDIKLNWFAFMRLDAILRDEEAGVFEKLVRSGLSHICVGVERIYDDELKGFGKGFYSEEDTRRCFKILNKKYPSVFRQATFIVGIRDETRESLEEMVKFAIEINADYPGFHPITPVPGTPLWNEALEKGWLEVKDFGKFDWMTPVMSSAHLSRREIEDSIVAMQKRFLRLRWLLGGLLTRHTYRRNMYLWWLMVTLRVWWAVLKGWMNPFNPHYYSNLQKPAWYDS